MTMTQARPSTEAPDFYAATPRPRPWWVPWLAAIVVAALAIAVGSYLVYGRNVTAASMRGKGGPPQVTGYAAGHQIRFIHTEASDPDVTRTLTHMMRSPVILVPSLARVPDSALGTVYVFANGLKTHPHGPLGYQPDVFDSVPGEPNYSPLRAVVLVHWTAGVHPRVVRSAGEVAAAEAQGELNLSRPGVVVNIPIVRWPGGHR
jgi:hypothetical protein